MSPIPLVPRACTAKPAAVPGFIICRQAIVRSRAATMLSRGFYCVAIYG
jgi:hypothetical protein